MANMQELMHKNISVGNPVTITLKNGKEVIGVFDSFDEDLFCIQLPNGYIQPISYDLVGTYDLVETAVLPAVRNCEPSADSIYEEIRDSSVDIFLLQRKFGKEQRDIYQRCSADIESLKHAIKMSETAPKFNRTPRIVAAIQTVSCENPGNPYLLALLGEIALLAKDPKTTQDIIAYYQRDWTDDCYKVYNLLRLLGDLSSQGGDFSAMKQLNTQCPEKLRHNMSKAMLYVLREMKMAPVLPTPVQIDSPAVYQMLTEKIGCLPDSGIKPAAASVHTQPSPKPAVTAVLSNQVEGQIVSYNPKLHFGFITDRQGNNYRFKSCNVIDGDCQSLKAGLDVSFTKGSVYSFKLKKQVDSAENIILIEQKSDLQYGYIILFMVQRGYGYIVQEKEYRGKNRGDIYFEISDVLGGESLDTRQNDYRISFQYAAGPRKRAINIRILEAMPKYDANFAEISQEKPMDFGKFDFVQDETLVIVQKTGKRCIGQYTGKKGDALSLRTMDNPETIVSFDEIDTIFFCGLITTYNVFSSSGLINGHFSFRITNVVNKHLMHLLKMGKQAVYPCLYSLIIDGMTSYISMIEYFTKEICEQLVWQSGKIQGLYRSDIYFSVDKEYRCYTSTVTDNTITKYLQNKDFLGQEVFYKIIYHRTADERRRGPLSASIVDIRSKYQLGKLMHYPDREQQDIQCGSHSYPCGPELSRFLDGTEVKIELTCRNRTSLVVGNLDCRDLALPSFVKINQQEKAVFDAKVRQAGLDGNYALQISLTEEMLEKQFLNPERAIGSIFKVCVTHDQLPQAIQVVEKYGYMLGSAFLNGLMMQLEALVGKPDLAAKYARSYLATSGGVDEFLTSVARAIKQRAFPPEMLRAHIISGEALPPIRNAGKIGYYDADVKSGYIEWSGGKLNFSHKDLVDHVGSQLDLDKFIYHVSFDVDHSRSVSKAVDVQVFEVEARNGMPVETGRKSDAVNAASSFTPDFWEDEILNIPADIMTLLEFKRDNFDLSGTIGGYLSKADRQKIKGGVFIGTAAEAEKLIRSLRNCYKGRPPYFQSTPVEIRPNFLLAAAKIHKEFVAGEDGDGFFCEKTGNSILFDYAFRYLSGNNAREPAEVEYYCESIFLNDFSASVKCRMQARCIADFFVGTSNIDLNGCGERGAIVGILRRTCKDISSLSKMLLNMPQEILKNLLDCAPSALLDEIAEMIIVKLNNGVLSEEVHRTEAIQQYYSSYHSNLQELIQDLTQSIPSVDNVQFFLDQIENMLESIGKHLFESDEKLFQQACRTISDIRTSLQTEDVDSRTDRLRLAWQSIRSIVRSIEEHPSKLSFETLRPFLTQLNDSLSDYLNNQYEACRPRLAEHHYSLHNNGRQEIIEISNADKCLPAINVRVMAAPYGSTDGFLVDTDGSRSITGNGQQIHGGKAAEFNIPIILDRNVVPDVLDMSLSISYEYKAHYDRQQGSVETATVQLTDQRIQIPVKIRESDFIYENPYAAFAGGKVMKPSEPAATHMFFGREQDIKDICRMLTDADGKLNAGSILAIYGQKRCGKSSVMFFLGEWLEKNYRGAIVLDINLQEVSPEDGKDIFYKKILAKICTSFRKKVRRFKELKEKMKAIDLHIPNTKDLASEFGEVYYQEFFQSFQEHFGKQSTIILMVDEFTQAYVHMKQHKISEDFLNRWRAMIQENGFVNVVVGQDFMDKFTTDEDITSQNFGGAVNGLGTMGRKRLSYLGKEAAQKMIEDPIRFSDGTSRYRGLLGRQAISYIYDLTGGSAFYLMKFCNALVEYMIEHQEQLVSRGLVETVASGYVFDAPNNPINKADFDPIFNEYSYRDVPDRIEARESDFDISAQVRDETKKTYSILKRIADAADSQGVCSVRKIAWPDKEERNHLLRSLMVRGVLTDQNGRDITTEQIDHLEVKIKVKLFSIWLKERG